MIDCDIQIIVFVINTNKGFLFERDIGIIQNCMSIGFNIVINIICH